MSLASPVLSVVVPCYNEEEVLLECHRRLAQVLRSLDVSFEIVFVNDGSRDRTPAMLRELHLADPAVTVVMLSRNFGHQHAVSAGLSVARGSAVVIIDADLQDPPEVIGEMLAVWRQGYQVVYGVRETREGESGFKLWTARAFYRIISRLSDVSIPVDTGDFRLLDRKAVNALLAMPERHRLLRAMCSWVGFRQYPLKYKRAARFAGTTKYPLKKMINLAMDGIVSFSTVPLRVVTFIGFLSALLACAGIIYSFAVRLFTHEWVRGWFTLILAILFMGGLQMMSLGILGEYIGRIYTEIKQRPLFLIDEFLQHPSLAMDDEEMRLQLWPEHRPEQVP
jgi:dolichol-phosphate mannosyltransferase